jgi:phosphoglycolate phosphatase-like HAD superfamily hydrolase
VGDRTSDIAAAVAAGIGLRILLRSNAHDIGEDAGCHTVDDLAQALALLRLRSGRSPRDGGER